MLTLIVHRKYLPSHPTDQKNPLPKAYLKCRGHFSDPALHITHSRRNSSAVQMFLNIWLSEEKGLGSQTFLISVALMLLWPVT